MTPGEWIKHYREKANMTQEELAAIIGITASNVSQIENNERGLRLDKADRICEALGITLQQLLD